MYNEYFVLHVKTGNGIEVISSVSEVPYFHARLVRIPDLTKSLQGAVILFSFHKRVGYTSEKMAL